MKPAIGILINIFVCVGNHGKMSACVCACVCVCAWVYVCITNLYRDERETHTHKLGAHMTKKGRSLYIKVYMHVCVYVCVCVCVLTPLDK